MKNYFLLTVFVFCVIACKKKATDETPPPTKTTIPTTTVTTKTITVYSKAYGGQGTIRINWQGNDTLSQDSIYLYSISKYTTKIIATDSISLFYFSKACGPCSYDPNDITVTVNGILKWAISSDVGNVRRRVKF